MPVRDKKALLEERGTIQKTMRQLLDSSAKEERDLTTEESGKFEELAQRADALTAQVARLDRMAEIEADTRAAQPGREDITPESEKRDDPAAAEKRQAEAFDAFLRFGREDISSEQRQALIETSDSEYRAMSKGGFGVVGVRPFYNRLVESQKLYAGVREAGAEVLPTQTGNQLTIPTIDDSANTGHILGEGAQETNLDTDPAMGNIALDAYKYSSKFIRLSLELIQDAAFDVQGKIIDTAAKRIGRAFNTHTVLGDGSNKPRGFVNAVAAGQIIDASGVTFGYDDLLDLMNGVDAAYWKARNAGFMFSQTLLTEARKLKDLDGRPIWTPAMGERGELIHGYKVTLNNELADFATGDPGDVVAAFGDWYAYKVRDVTQPFIARDTSKFLEYGEVGFIVFSRHDGDLDDPKAIACLSIPAAT